MGHLEALAQRNIDYCCTCICLHDCTCMVVTAVASTQCTGKCLLRPEAGFCEAYIPSYFFNGTSDRCEEFIYGGCNGNDNKFSTYEECQRECPNG